MPTRFRVTPDRKITGQGLTFPCAIGRGGMVEASKKNEGDGASPIGLWKIKRVFWRADKLDRPKTALPATPLHPDDGWCDAPDDPLYNCAVKRPYPASNEEMWREDDVYDVVVQLDHNTDPVVPGKGSAIFMHVAKPDYAPTEGCIALSLDDLKQLLQLCEKDSAIEILRAS
ncbi:L,D-transpeptidase family protein [Henriciella marina]|uniref:L,D-transpeptidase family protein n=1 Tax=Henriciella marina TaxID=453851 RepID=UPI00039FBA6C|nr:L,D-transpeptidase family protein [Henriciella marina]